MVAMKYTFFPLLLLLTLLHGQTPVDSMAIRQVDSLLQVSASLAMQQLPE
jgi:hypothetical protein